jgi:glucuronyl/N-acetylglucosaminyl transferase EXT2
MVHSLEKKYKIVSTQPFINSSAKLQLEQLATERDDLYIFDICDPEGSDYLLRCRHGQQYRYDQILSQAEFCLIFDEYEMCHSHYTAQMALFDVLKFGCIPVIVSEEWLLPFEEILDWELIAIQLRYFYLKDLSAILLMRSDEEVAAMKKQVKFVFERYFSSMKNITLMLLKSLEMQVFPNTNRNFYELYNFEKVGLGFLI